MTGPGYSISVPWSVRITWSGEYLHDAFWSVGDQGFSNVSHGCVNMSPANAETFYKMTVPGDPVKITRQPQGRHVGQRLDHVVPVVAQVRARQRAEQGGADRPERQHVRQRKRRRSAPPAQQGVASVPLAQPASGLNPGSYRRIRGSPKCGNTPLPPNQVIAEIPSPSSVSTSIADGRATSV